MYRKIVSSVVNCVGVESYSIRVGRVGKAKVEGIRAGYYFGSLAESAENEDTDRLVVSGVILRNVTLKYSPWSESHEKEVHVWCSSIC
jgi:hypothetical protein